MTERNGSKLEDIHAHAVKTNGRVTKLERWSLVFITALVVLLSTNSNGVIQILKSLPWLK